MDEATNTPQSVETVENNLTILEPVFENFLRLSKNSLKLNYSKIKNAILSYKLMKCEFNGAFEIFTKGKDKLFLMSISVDKLLLNCALPEGSLDKKVYPHRLIKKEEFKPYPVQISVSGSGALKRALELVTLVMDTKKIPKANVAVPVAYGEKYPFIQNAAIKGFEDKIPKDTSGDEYKDIYGEITKNIVAAKLPKPDGEKKQKPLKGAEKLTEKRQTATTVKGAIALAEPIVYFYDAVADRENKVAFVYMQQVLNDKFSGKILPQHYFAVAEGSERIDKLNFLQLETIVKDCEMRPDLLFAMNVSCRLLLKKDNLKKLIKNSKTTKENLIFVFDCALLEALGELGFDAVSQMKDNGLKIMADNVEQAGMKVLTEYYIDYIRIDARYYAEDKPKAVSHLDMLTGYAKVQGITTVATGVENTKQAIFMLSHGVDCIQGMAVCNPRRLVHAAVREKKNLPAVGG